MSMRTLDREDETMSTESEMTAIESRSSQLSRARVTTVGDTGMIIVERDDTPGERLACDLLETSGTRLALRIGDTVLLWLQPDGRRGLVVGRIPDHDTRIEDVDVVPETLVLEAKQSLTLRVGDGSITIREDGKILIKGKDLVSHAQRMNRIKGGAVSIN